MAARVEVLRRVLVLGGIAAADVSAGQAEAQVDPAVAALQALLATFAVRVLRLEPLQMLAGRGHDFLTRRARDG